MSGICYVTKKQHLEIAVLSSHLPPNLHFTRRTQYQNLVSPLRTVSPGATRRRAATVAFSFSPFLPNFLPPEHFYVAFRRVTQEFVCDKARSWSWDRTSVPRLPQGDLRNAMRNGYRRRREEASRRENREREGRTVTVGHSFVVRHA